MADGSVTSSPPGTGGGGGSSSVQDTAQEMTGKAQEKAHEVAGEAQEKAQEMAGKAQEGVRQQLDDRTTKAGEQVSSTAQDLRSVGEELRKQGKDTPAKLADRAAEQTEKVGTYLKEADADRMLHDVEDFGRQRPWAVLAGGMVLGVAAARFLKASSRSRYQQRSGTTAAAQVSQGTTPLPRRSAVEPVATPPPSTALPGDPAPGTGGMGTPGTAGTGIPAQNSAPATPSPAR